MVKIQFDKERVRTSAIRHWRSYLQPLLSNRSSVPPKPILVDRDTNQCCATRLPLIFMLGKRVVVYLVKINIRPPFTERAERIDQPARFNVSADK